MSKIVLSLDSIVTARQHIDEQNKLDAESDISPWNIGLPAEGWIPASSKAARVPKHYHHGMKGLEQATKQFKGQNPSPRGERPGKSERGRGRREDDGKGALSTTAQRPCP